MLPAWRAEEATLCRYITRPAIANERLTLNRAGNVVLKLKSPYHDGTTHVVMSPLELMPRLAALVPRPRFRGMRARPEVAFVSPRTRTLAATLELSSKTASVILPAELIPSGQHDPLLKGLQRKPAGLHEVVLSASAAERLKVRKGAAIEASLSRQYQARHERVRLDLQIVDVASERAFARPAVFASLEVLMAAEAFRDGRAVAALGWSGDPPLAEERVFPSFRLYARTIYDVAGLASVLTEAGQRVKTAAAEIETVRSIDRNLALLFWVIAAAGMAGYSLSLGASLLANTDRKRRELSVPRLLGFRGGGSCSTRASTRSAAFAPPVSSPRMGCGRFDGGTR
jgi:putative ABC transport system permease protein